MKLSEDDVRAKFITGLKDCGWSEDCITRNYPITDDRFVVFGDNLKIKTKLKADYVLKYNSIILSLVEAKAEGENLKAFISIAELCKTRYFNFLY